LLANECLLIFGGRLLRRDVLIRDYGIQNGSTLTLLLTLSGGNGDDDMFDMSEADLEAARSTAKAISANPRKRKLTKLSDLAKVAR